MTDLRAAIEAIPTHDIGGYEWECWSCHMHWRLGSLCSACKQVVTQDNLEGRYWEDGSPASDHNGDLIARSDVLKLLEQA